MLKSLTPRGASFLIFTIALATLVGAWIFEISGYAPCELCLLQRWAYYGMIPLALVAGMAARAAPGFARFCLLVLALTWMSSMIFGIYHSGVEWKWWLGPNTCGSIGDFSGGLPDLSAPVILCDTPAIRILGLSLAGWNAMISAVLALVAFAGFRAQGSSSVSQ